MRLPVSVTTFMGRLLVSLRHHMKTSVQAWAGKHRQVYTTAAGHTKSLGAQQLAAQEQALYLCHMATASCSYYMSGHTGKHLLRLPASSWTRSACQLE